MEEKNVTTENERKLTGFWQKLSQVFGVLSEFIWALPPAIVLISMLILFKTNGLYPFADKTIAWCDMDQQVIPLLLDFKDILAGKEGFFFSFKNAGGMNFYGVFFFFLSSPFTFLVAFVDKADIASFCNVLVMLKMCAAAGTASLYLARKRKGGALLNVFLSVLYAYSGYTMMYYQNVIWLDVVYLFPLLLLGLERLQEGKRTLFIAALSACMVVNYYLGYMLVVFLLLYAFVWLILSKDKKFAANFCVSCFVAALLTAVVWLPSLWQYFSSGRTTSILQGLRNSSVLTHYQTAWPTVFSVLFLFPFALSRKEGKSSKLQRILLVATLVPVVLEPINKMWQTGSYMSFPTRYAFIPIFLCLSLAFDEMVKPCQDADPRSGFWERLLKKWKNELPVYAVSVGLLLVAIWYYAFSKSYTDANATVMDQYSQSLWGNAQSFDALVGLYALAVGVGVLWYIFKKFRLFKPVFLWLAVGAMVASELYVAPTVYMLTPAHEVDWYQQVVELADKIEDEGFYRVKSDKEYSGRDFDANLMGGLGYNALGHYTSLTRDNYMTAIKQFGYTSYWMEVGNSGGTWLSDALTSVKYEISGKATDEDIYDGTYFNISPTEAYLPLGVIAKADIIALNDGRKYDRRGELQKTLCEDFFGVDGVTVYGLNDATAYNLTVSEEDGKYLLTPNGSGAKLTFRVPVSALSTIYFNAFDENTNALKQAINEKFSVKASGYYTSSYPTQKNNGLLELGEYEARTVSVEIGVKETVRVRDLSVFAIENEMVRAAIAQTETVGLTAEKSSLVGRYEAKGGECVFVSVAYDEGMRLEINGKKAELYEVYDGFTAFYLEEGENEIELTFRPKGFSLGLGTSLVGLGLCAAAAAVWVWKKQRLETPASVDTAAYYGLFAVGAAVIVVIYIAPMILCLL